MFVWCTLAFFFFFQAEQYTAVQQHAVAELVDSFIQSNMPEEREKLGNRLMAENSKLSIEEARKIRKNLTSGVENAPYDYLGYLIMGDVFYYKNNLDSSFYYYMLQGSSAERKGDFLIASNGYGNAGYVLDVQGRLGESISLRKLAINQSRKANSMNGVSTGYYNLAAVFDRLGRKDSAYFYIQRAMNLDRKHENKQALSYDLQFLTELELKSQDWLAAVQYAEECVAVSSAAGFDREVSNCLYSLAVANSRAGRVNAALENINEAIKVDTLRGDDSRLGKYFRTKAGFLRMEKPEVSLQLLTEALRYNEQRKSINAQVKTRLELAEVYDILGNEDACLSQFSTIENLMVENTAPDLKMLYADRAYTYYQQQGLREKAESLLQEKLTLIQAENQRLRNASAIATGAPMDVFRVEEKLNQMELERQLEKLRQRRRNGILIGAGFILFLLLLLAYFAYQNQKNKTQLLEKRNVEEKLRMNLTVLEKELGALRSQMNPHFMFNSLNSINDYIMHENPRLASKYLAKFSRLMRMILNNSKQKFVTLEEELKAVKLYMELEQLRFSEAFIFNMEISSAVNDGNVYLPPMLIQPFLENAVKHGMKGIEKDGEILLAIDQLDSDRLSIRIKDNGMGRSQAMKNRRFRNPDHKSYGTEITSNRIELLNKIYDVEASVEYIDHVSPSGTEVIIILSAKEIYEYGTS